MAPVLGWIATTAAAVAAVIGGQRLVGGFCAAGLMVSSTVAPCFCLPVSRAVKLCTASRGSVPASRLFSASSMPDLP